MPPIRPELLDELLKDYKKPDDLLGQDGLLQQLIKALVERALDGELTDHLGYERHDSSGDNSGNSRNGTTPKTLRGKRGQVQIDVPRDRTSEFEPQLVKKGQTRFDGLKGFPEAIEAIFPQTQVQLCMVHMVRHALSYVSHRDRKAVATDLKMIYQAATLDMGGLTPNSLTQNAGYVPDSR
jgi:transposase-like protein